MSALRSFLFFLITCMSLFVTTHSFAEEKFLPAEQAFPLQVRSISESEIQLHWTISPSYYLYQHQFAVDIKKQKNAQVEKVKLDLPPAEDKHDEYYGDTKVYHDAVSFKIQAEPNATYHVRFQGCAEAGLCYPISQSSFQTDAMGLVSLDQEKPSAQQPSLFEQSNQGGLLSTATQNDSSQGASKSNLVNDENVNIQAVAEDEQWTARLHDQNAFWSILIFLGLGCLLAFTPCSLPMLPILSSLLIREHVGVRAGAISIVFVLAMASVYALLGVLAASAGSNLQRWLQQPVVLIAFASVFVIFALNLFGVFELKLPQKWSNHLDQLQGRQKGGTLLGAALMGVLSALLVGPCMTAPLAGTLLYISQSQNLIIGAVLLFSLGVGMGIPLIILSLIGQKAMPKPGQWMHRIRHVFAWVMLGLALYFVRPLLSAELFYILMLILILLVSAYLLYLIWESKAKIRLLFVATLIAVLGFGVWQAQTLYRLYTTAEINWQVVKNKTQFDRALADAKTTGQPIIVDLYADWCIACQPIERNIWTNPDVQQSLKDVQKIKLDLSEFDASHQMILNEWQLLGPPTVLFISSNGQELRPQRLTGSFSQQELLQRLQSDQIAR